MTQSKSFTGAKDGTAQPVTDTRKSNLTTRILSALVMIPPVLAATYFGFPYFNILIAAAAAAMAWEWRCMVSGGHFGFEGLVMAAGLLGAVVAASLGAYTISFLALGLIIAVFFISSAARRLKRGSPAHSMEMDQALHPVNTLWMAFGVLYIGIPSLAMIWIRSEWDNGLLVMTWLLILVWAADSGAYAAGRLIGGPKMAPKISPNKTWAGLGGCAAAAAAAGVGVAAVSGLDDYVTPLLVSALIGVISQGGDLVESFIKRHFKVKDSSQLIPGHGGVLDRVDALLAAIAAAALISLVSRGVLMS